MTMANVADLVIWPQILDRLAKDDEVPVSLELLDRQQTRSSLLHFINLLEAASEASASTTNMAS